MRLTTLDRPSVRICLQTHDIPVNRANHPVVGILVPSSQLVVALAANTTRHPGSARSPSNCLPDGAHMDHKLADVAQKGAAWWYEDLLPEQALLAAVAGSRHLLVGRFR